MNSLEEINRELDLADEDLVFDPIPRKREPKKISNAKTYIQLLVEGYEKEFIWDNKTYFKDRSLLYIKANQLVNKKSDSQLKGILDWTRGKKLHPLAVVSIINKALI